MAQFYRTKNLRPGETKGLEYEDTALVWLERKLEYCKEHLQLQAVLAPGLSEYRAYISGTPGCTGAWSIRVQSLHIMQVL
jgi:hypothetical protein